MTYEEKEEILNKLDNYEGPYDGTYYVLVRQHANIRNSPDLFYKIDSLVDSYQKEFFIRQIGKEDAYYKYNLTGSKIKIFKIIQTYPHNDYFSAKVNILSGKFKGEMIHLFRLRVSERFPFKELIRQKKERKNG
jgi:hypothetical protein